jgi:hypothetical protein
MKTLTAQRKEIIKGAPAPELVDLWLARAFNAQDVEAAAAMYHPDASVVRLEQVHGSTIVARGADDGGLHRAEAAHGRRRAPHDRVWRLRLVPLAMAHHRHRQGRKAD